LLDTARLGHCPSHGGKDTIRRYLMRLLGWHRGRVALAVGVLVLVGGGVAYATIPGSDGTISACYNTLGQLRVVDSDAGQTCRRDEKAVSLSAPTATPRLVCPTGTTLSTGVCIENSTRSATDVSSAVRNCASDGRRLPSPGELSTFREIDGITLATAGEWTDDVADITHDSSFDYLAVTDNGNGVVPADHSLAYRCVAGVGIG
jgi:hypothetical protein